jgi:heptosyltransferase-2
VKRILIIQTAFLGDVILATPVVSELKRIFPLAEIDVLVKKGNEALLQNNPNIRYCVTFDKRKGKYRSIIHLVINLHRFASSGIIAGFSGAKKKYGFKKNPFSFLYSKSFSHEISFAAASGGGNGIHEVERNLSMIQEFGAVTLKRPELFPTKDQFDKVKSFQTVPYFCFAPASVWFTKQLPKEKWIELIQRYSSQGSILLLGGKDDCKLCDEIIQTSKITKGLNLAGELNLLESAALMKSAQRNFVNDSGPLHIASAMNAPVTAFFCSTIPAFGFGPLSEDSDIAQVENLACRPCGLHGHKACPKKDFKCGNEIKID